ncbi:hypothetical protein KC19_1G214000 [Ceratodon purpureus]|uniref:CDP-diacylglycerol--serine O-phosphatidyltransferase n=1 Tax=Ceratodon purpureus TaxID=3225 RepID=A0A8T0JAG8_CERPU|nr:hypothetical protein KC19_1G214000 [Ceratodon purpureus]KAG0591949.1 hypothetical protein KC19_1G214000 [Ceratodon purpureus]KAG0591953.1 hypothetical protein KC19_1G214000 [Ceratodon purpureus]KAG0591954.1 hypothetical protein KC19_1G214000 [Ceratodon purpureus]
MGKEISFSEAEDSSGCHGEKFLLEHDGGVDDWRDEDGSIVSGGGNRIVREDSESKAWSIMRDLDPWTAWLYKPHTVTVLIVGACLLVWASGALQSEEHDLDTVTNYKRGVWATIAVFLGYCLLQAPSTILIRPHPAFWRFIHGIAVVYLVFLTFLLFQKRVDARRFLKNLHPDLGVELNERSYGADCRIYTPEKSRKFSNVYDTLFDEFVIAHTLGWWGKAIMIRNLPLLWTLSIGFEMAEVTFNHMLPNFNECWWDSIILDVFCCNWIGIWAGMKTVKYFDGKTYAWVGLSRQTSILGKVRRSLGQFTPAYWDKDEWNPLQGPLRFVQVLALVVLVLTVEVNAFFLKFCLWIPPLNPLNSYRLIIWWLIANPAIREFNTFLQTRKPIKKLGAFCWLALAIAIVETLICIKFGRGLYPKPMPRFVFWFWATLSATLVLFLSTWTIKVYLDSIRDNKHTEEMDSKKSM